MIALRSWPVRNAWFFRALHIPVLLGTALAAAVLTGSLVIGDSLRGSLRARSERQLNGIDAAFLGTSFIDEQRPPLPGTTVPLLLLQGSLEFTGERGVTNSATSVTFVGVTDEGRKFFNLSDYGNGPAPVVLGARTARALGCKTGSTIRLGLEKRSAIPRSSVLSKKNLDDVTTTTTVIVTAILPDEHPANDLQLLPNPNAPSLIYLPLNVLQQSLDKPNRVNASVGRGATASELNATFSSSLTLRDYGVRVSLPSGERGYLSVESEQLLLKPELVDAITKTAAKLNASAEPTVVTLANVVSLGSEIVKTNDPAAGKKLFAYSVVAGLNPQAVAPLGPFLPSGVPQLADDEILLTDWAESPLAGLPIGSPITLTYFRADQADAGEQEDAATFRLAGTLPMAGPAGDANLAPPFPGITDKLSIGDWEEPFTMNKRRITRQDDAYWERHKATPKAYINLTKAKQLFASRFGTVTSVRIAVPAGKSRTEFAATFQSELTKTLDPVVSGLVFESTRERLLKASQGGTDFGMLFLLFSGLLILSASLLTGLLFRLLIERRAKEVGLLTALGWDERTLRATLVREGLLVAVVGALVGVPVGILYAMGMLGILVQLWPDAEVGSYLGLHVAWWSPLLGFVLTLLTAWGTLRLSLRGMLQLSVPQLLRGRATEETTTARSKRRWLPPLLVLFAFITLAIGPTRTNPDERAGAFFTGGLLLLTAGLFFIQQWLKQKSTTQLHAGTASLLRLGVRNAARRSSRTLLMIALVSLSVFLVVSVESFRRRTDDTFLERTGGSGGFPLVAEVDVPLFHPLDSEKGKEDLELRLEAEIQEQVKRDPTGPNKATRLDAARAELQHYTAYPFRLNRGDDASCLNLYQAAKPRLLGVPPSIIDRGGFRFTQTKADSPEEVANPWLLLRRKGDIIPAFAEQNTVYFMLKTTLGGIVEVPDEQGNIQKIQIVGLLQDSVFQSELLIADERFRTLYPSQDGYNIFLLDVAAEHRAGVTQQLKTALRTNGITVQSSSDITNRFLAVVSAYLTVFQLLGGLGLVLSILGVSVVILRNIRERSGELALLRAVGWPARALQKMILGETLFFLVAGLGLGILSALAAVLPNLALGGSVPWQSTGLLAVATLIVGVVVASIAVRAVSQQEIIPALRAE